ncbi:MAG: peptidylprolyl isomerase [Ilumatobacteraceae bacterium]
MEITSAASRSDWIQRWPRRPVNNFIGLARYHYYDGVSCHRVITDFVVQCGDPSGTGRGVDQQGTVSPGYRFPDELPASIDQYIQYSVAMANAGANTNGSQFFIATSTSTAQQLGRPLYTLFGQVVAGESVIDRLNGLGSRSSEGNPTEPIQMISVTVCVTGTKCAGGS